MTNQVTHDAPDIEDFESRIHKAAMWGKLGQEEAQFDPVEKPKHYTKGTFECIDVLRETMSHTAYCGFLEGNVKKYLWRWRDKNGVEDLKKAQWYLNKLIDSF